MDTEQKYSVITEQGDYGLGAQEITDEEQKKLNEAKDKEKNK